jgi:hypothetical protein
MSKLGTIESLPEYEDIMLNQINLLNNLKVLSETYGKWDGEMNPLEDLESDENDNEKKNGDFEDYETPYYHHSYRDAPYITGTGGFNDLD